MGNTEDKHEPGHWLSGYPDKSWQRPNLPEAAFKSLKEFNAELLMFKIHFARHYKIRFFTSTDSCTTKNCNMTDGFVALLKFFNIIVFFYNQGGIKKIDKFTKSLDWYGAKDEMFLAIFKLKQIINSVTGSSRPNYRIINFVAGSPLNYNQVFLSVDKNSLSLEQWDMTIYNDRKEAKEMAIELVSKNLESLLGAVKNIISNFNNFFSLHVEHLN